MITELNQNQCWGVSLTLPPEEGRKYKENKYLGVVAVSVDEVIKEVIKLYPTAVIWNINHRGTVHVIGKLIEL